MDTPKTVTTTRPPAVLITTREEGGSARSWPSLTNHDDRWRKVWSKVNVLINHGLCVLLFWLLWHALKNTLNLLDLLFLGLVWYGLGFLCGANSRRWRRVHSRTSHGPKHSRGTNKSSNPNWNENAHTFVKYITPLIKKYSSLTSNGKVILPYFFINNHSPRFGQKHVWEGKDWQKIES